MTKSCAFLVAGGLLALSVLGSGRQTVTLEVSKMDCSACPITVRLALERVPGVAAARVDYKAKTAVVTFDPGKTEPSSLVKATAEAGFPSTIRRVGH
jgi:mercuric ion binding protein